MSGSGQGLPVDGRTARWEAHRARRRRELLDAANAVLAETGPDFGLDQVAERAGVTKPVIYRHFADRNGLVDALGERVTELLLDEWMLPVLRRPDATPMDRIRGAVGGYLGFLDAHPHVYWLYVRHAPAEGSEVAQVNKDLIAAAVSATLGSYIEVVVDERDGVEVWGHGLVGFVQNAAEWWLRDRSLTLEAMADYLARLIWGQIDGMTRVYGIVIDPHAVLAPGDVARMAEAARVTGR